MDEPFSVYIHVPFCSRRCGYCDFNTYTAADLGGGAAQKSYANLVRKEIALANQAFFTSKPTVQTVYFGGGTPTVLPPSDLISILQGIRETWALAPQAEVTTEANPDSVTKESILELANGGFTRISFGMQSAVPHVLQALDRTHNPANIGQVVGWAQDVGLKVSLDLIYGTPGESLADWQQTVEAAINTGVDHISAYALTVAPNTKLGRHIASGTVPAPDDDDMAAKYELADTVLATAGLEWYEISNWARGGIGGENACRHNLAYWYSHNWLGVGPGAHSHLNGTRFWNVAHPRKWAEMLAAGELPIAGSEKLTDAERALEMVFLELRLATGISVADLTNYQSQLRDHSKSNSDPVAQMNQQLATLIATGLISSDALTNNSQVRLTPKGRLLADSVVQSLT